MKLYRNISIYFFIWIVALIVILTFGLTNFSQTENISKNLANWDGGHYLAIAQTGYKENFQYAFFPLYPLVTRFVSGVIGDYLAAAILVSISSSFFALHFLYKLIYLEFSKQLAEKAVIFFLIFPTSFYLITAYSEGLFLLLAVLSFYFLRKKRLILAVICASLASVTRISGLAVAAALIIQVATTDGINRKNWFVLLAPLGFVIYCIYLYKFTGDPFYFLTAEEENWKRSLTIPGVSFLGVLRNLTQPGYITAHFNNFLELLFAIFGLGMALRAFRFLPAGLSVYGLLSVLFPLFTSTMMSMPRFLITIFPIFILLAMIKNQKVIFLIQLFFILFLSAFGILFINGYWAS